MRSISLGLTFLLFFQLNFSVYAQINPDGGSATTLETAPNGTPVVNIAAPNNQGLSHNTYNDFNVDPSGAVLNNAQALGQSQQAGVILGNPNLQGSGPANIILNEVTSSNRSLLEGHTEVHGQRAEVIIANPNGITCNGCGFINTPRATLTTGTSEIQNGQLKNLSVNGGDITIGARGLNATGADALELLAREIKVQGGIHANDLKVVTGRNDYDYQAQTASAKADNGSTKPTYGLDSTAVGGMYAGRITLIATENGVGVKAPENMVASAGDLVVNAQGEVVLQNASATGNAQLQAERVQVKQKLYAQNNVSVQAAAQVQVDSGAVLSAGNDVTVESDSLSASGALLAAGIDESGASVHQGKLSLKTQAPLVLGETLLFAGNEVALESQQVDLSRSSDDGSTSMSAPLLTLKTDVLDLTHNRLVADSLNLETQQNLVLDTGEISVFQDLSISSHDLTNSITLNADNLSLNLSGDLHNQASGTLIAGTKLSVHADDAVNNGVLASLGELEMFLTGELQNNALIVSNDSSVFSLDGNLTNFYGEIFSGNNLTIQGLSSTRADHVENISGRIESLNNMSITAHSFTNRKEHFTVGTGAWVGPANANLADPNMRVLFGPFRYGSVFFNTNLQWVAIDLMNGNTSLYNDYFYTHPVHGFTVDDSVNIHGNAYNPNNSLRDYYHLDVVRSLYQQPTFRFNGEFNYLTGAWTALTYSVPGIDPDPQVSLASVDQNDPWKNSLSFIQMQWAMVAETQIQEDFIHVNSPAATLLAGGNLAIDATTISNNWSEIAAGGNVQLTGQTLNNISTNLIRREKETTKEWFRVNGCFGGAMHHIGATLACGVNAYADFTLPVGTLTNQYYGQYAVPTTQTDTVFNSVNATITAGGSLTGNFIGQINNTTIRQNTALVPTLSGTGSPNLSTPTPSSLNPSQVVSSLSNSSLFVATPGISAQYLYETDSRFLDISRFLGSDYFLERMNFEPDVLQKRLGDAFVEARVIQDQIRRQTGRRFLEGFGNDFEQVQALYDNALLEQEALGLEFGIALTQEQIQSLDRDLVWMEVEIINGEEVLVPKLYLASAEPRNLIGGEIAGDKGLVFNSSEITNEGLLSSQGELALNTTNLTNNQGLIKAKQVELRVKEDLVNRSGTIQGKNVTIDAGSITSVTSKIRHDHGAQGFEDQLLNTATIAAEGNLVMRSREDVNAIGASFSAGKNLILEALGDVNLSAQAVETYQHLTYGKGYSKNYVLKNHKTTLGSGGSLSIQSGKNITLVGVDATSKGSMDIKATGDVTIASVQDESYQETYTKTSKRGAFGSKKGSVHITKSSSTTQRSELNSGGDLTITSEAKDITLQAASLESEGSIALNATEGSVNLTTNRDSKSYSEKRQEKSKVWQKSVDKGSYDEEIQHTEIVAGKGFEVNAQTINVEILEQGDIQASITELAKDPKLAYLKDLQNNPNVNWTAIQEAHESWNYEQEGLTAGAAMLISLAVGIATGGSGAALGSTLLSSLASQASVSLIDNKGNLSAVLKEMATIETVKSLAMTAITAGATQNLNKALKLNPTATKSLTTTQKLSRNLVSAGVRTSTETALYGGNVRDTLLGNLKQAGVDFVGEIGANKIGELYQGGQGKIGYGVHKVLHGGLGYGLAELAGKKGIDGAVGAIVGETVGEAYFKANGADKNNYVLRRKTTGTANLAAVSTAFITGQDSSTALQTSNNAVQNNLLVSFGVEGIADVREGGEANAGLYFSFPFLGDGAALEWGSYVSLGKGGGTYAGGGLVLGVYKGDVRNLVGNGATINIGLGPLGGGSINFDGENKFLGISFGIPRFNVGVGVSAHETITDADSPKFGQFKNNPENLFKSAKK